MTNNGRKRIAIIGAGISGLGAAHMLYQFHDVTIYEKNPYPGGHARTIDVKTPEGIVPVDTGFIVFNDRNYPLLCRLFKDLHVPFSPTPMSFGVSIDQGWLEYGTHNLRNLFAQKRNLLRPQFWGMIRDILRFNRRAKEYINSDPSVTLSQCLDELKLGNWFQEYYLMSMGAAIWSAPLSQILDFPAASFIRFFDNHGLLTVNDQPQWYTVVGGSRVYIERLVAPFLGNIRLSCGVNRVIRTEKTLIVIDDHGQETEFDDVIFACHADQALAMIETPHEQERYILSAFRYQPNQMFLHSDVRLMPKNKKAWASWVYLSDARKDDNSLLALSYWMNRLQPLKTNAPIIVTLNPSSPPQSDLVHDVHWFDHPIFDTPAIEAQTQLSTIQGKDRLWFCGAYQRNGFHEDGLNSAVNMVKQMGIEATWI